MARRYRSPQTPIPTWLSKQLFLENPFRTRKLAPKEETLEEVRDYALNLSTRPGRFAVPKSFLESSMTTTSTLTSPWRIDPEHKVHLNVNRIQEYLTHYHDLFLIQRGINIQVRELELLCGTGFSLHKWLSANFTPYTMFDKDTARGVWPHGELETDRVLVEINMSKSGIDFEYSGSEVGVSMFKEWMATQNFKPKEVIIEWAFGKDYSNMETYDLPLSIRPDLTGAYPWMKETIPEFAARYFDSHESVLVLKGAPGTGKTSFIKKLIQASGGSAMVTYDTQLLNSDGFFATFMMKDDVNILVVEDADDMLLAREEGNRLMDRLLNASDGLISLKHKKIVFSTNLGNVSSIDPALLRKGRCFDILDFRKLDQAEAGVVASAFYGENVEFPKGSYSLAEITNMDREKLKIAAPIQKLGFTG